MTGQIRRKTWEYMRAFVRRRLKKKHFLKAAGREQGVVNKFRTRTREKLRIPPGILGLLCCHLCGSAGARPGFLSG
jgi:hypothetical protein